MNVTNPPFSLPAAGARGSTPRPVRRPAATAPVPGMKKQAGGLREELESRVGADEPIQMATVRLLGARKPADATAALLAYLPFAPDDNVADAVRHALAAVNKGAKEADPALPEALPDN